jgi:hypothetical protein
MRDGRISAGGSKKYGNSSRLNIKFKNSEIIYDGGPLYLGDVTFENCILKFGNDAVSQRAVANQGGWRQARHARLGAVNSAGRLRHTGMLKHIRCGTPDRDWGFSLPDTVAWRVEKCC